MPFETIIAIIGVSAALTSAIAAFISFLFSRKVHKDTLALITPKERPIIALINEVSDRIFVSMKSKQWSFHIMYKLKNSGERPAIDLTIKYGAGPLDETQAFHQIPEAISNSNPFYPGTIIDMDEYLTLNFLTGEFKNQAEFKMLFYIRLEYKDKWNPSKSFSDDIYFSYENDIGTLSHSSSEIRNRFKESVENVFGRLMQ